VTGLPCLVVSLNETQSREAAALAARGAVLHLGALAGQSDETLAAGLLRCAAKAHRDGLARGAQALIDGVGRARVARGLMGAIETATAGVLS
jgi:spore coat polysaccharide biosynthesis predicted glycosyltransferase SpsG